MRAGDKVLVAGTIVQSAEVAMLAAETPASRRGEALENERGHGVRALDVRVGRGIAHTQELSSRHRAFDRSTVR